MMESTMTAIALRAATLPLMGAVLLAGCSSEDYPTSAASQEQNGTMTATVATYGPWIASRIVSATYANGSLTIVGEDVNFKKITLFLIGVTPTTTGLPREINLTMEGAETDGYVEMRERYQVGTYIYNTFNGGHALVTLTTLAADRVAGTFSFLAERPVNSQITPTFRSGSSGVFDIRVPTP